MYEKILVPLDGTPLSEAILPNVAEMAQRTGAEVILFQAVSPSTERVFYHDVDAPPVYLDQEIERVRLEAEIYLRRIASGLKDKGIPVRIVVAMDTAADGILLAAERVNPDIIAMSTHGRKGWGRLIHGSVAEKVVRHSTRPVVLVKPDGKEAKAA